MEASEKKTDFNQSRKLSIPESGGGVKRAGTVRAGKMNVVCGLRVTHYKIAILSLLAFTVEHAMVVTHPLLAVFSVSTRFFTLSTRNLYGQHPVSS